MKIRTEILLAAVLLVLVNFMLVIVFSDKGLVDFYQRGQMVERQRADNRRLEMQNLALHRKVRRLHEDPVYLEAVARKELGLVRPDEVVLTLKEAPGRTDGQQPAHR